MDALRAILRNIASWVAMNLPEPLQEPFLCCSSWVVKNIAQLLLFLAIRIVVGCLDSKFPEILAMDEYGQERQVHVRFNGHDTIENDVVIKREDENDHLQEAIPEDGHNVSAPGNIEDLDLEVVQNTSRPVLQAVDQRTQQNIVAVPKALDEAIIRPLDDKLATAEADLVTGKNELVAVKNLLTASQGKFINRYIVVPPTKDELDLIYAHISTDLDNRIVRVFQPEVRRIALEAHHDLDETVKNTRTRMHEQIGLVMDLSKDQQKLLAMVKELQTTVQEQNEQIYRATEQREESPSPLVALQNVSTSANADLDTVSKIQEELNAQVSRMTIYSAATDEMKINVDRINSETQQHLGTLEATVSSQATTILTLTQSKDALTIENTNLWERLARIEATVNDQQTLLQTLSALLADFNALETKLKTFPEPNEQGSVSASADPAVADTLKQNNSRFMDHASQLKELSGMKTSIDTAKERHMEHNDRIGALEAELRNMSTSQKKVKKQIGNIQQSLSEQEVLSERANATAMDVGLHMEKIKQLQHLDLAKLDEDLMRVVNEAIPEMCHRYDNNVKEHREWIDDDDSDIKSLKSPVAECEIRLNIDTAGGNAENRHDDDSHDDKRDENSHGRVDDDEGDDIYDDNHGGDVSGIKATNPNKQVPIKHAPVSEDLHAASSTTPRDATDVKDASSVIRRKGFHASAF